MSIHKDLYNRLNAKKDRWTNEEEVRLGWVMALSECLKIDIDAERGKKDSSYNNVIIEFKDKGLFKAKISSPAFKEAINDRLLPYILKTAKKESRDESDYIGIAIDGDHICFAQVKEGRIEHGHLLPFSEISVTMVATAFKDAYRRALIADNLIEDFGHSSDCGIKLMTALAVALAKSINDFNNN
jgi:hypothetical protein